MEYKREKSVKFESIKPNTILLHISIDRYEGILTQV